MAISSFKRHDTMEYCLHDVTDLLRGSYGETGVMDFGLIDAELNY